MEDREARRVAGIMEAPGPVFWEARGGTKGVELTEKTTSTTR